MKDKNVIYCSYQSYSIELSSLLLNKYNWVPKYWLTTDNIVSEVRNRYGDVICHNYYDSVKGVPARSNKLTIPTCIDVVKLEAFSKYEHTFLNLLERNDSFYGCFGYRERLDFFYSILKYWEGVIKSLHIDVVIFEEEPHQASDYILYILAKYYKLYTVVPVRTMPELGIMITDDIEDLWKVARHTLKKANFVPNIDALSKDTKKYLSLIRGEYTDVVKSHFWDQIKYFHNNETGLFSRIKYASDSFFRTAKKIPKYINNISNYSSDQKVPGKLFRESRLSYLSFVVLKQKAIKIKKKNKRYYESIASKDVNINNSYIFFALQYQPEKSTCPMGGRFVDQHLAIEMLSEALPDGWTLYVKEHPSQFVPSYTRYGERYRSESYYDRINSLDNVQLVSVETDTYFLIDNAQAVASVGGTVCWESIVRKRPALLFGKSWYIDCSYIHKVDSYESLKSAIKQVEEGIHMEQKEITDFICKVDFFTFKGAIGGPASLSNVGLTSSENAKHHLSAIESLIEYWERYL